MSNYSLTYSGNEIADVLNDLKMDLKFQDDISSNFRIVNKQEFNVRDYCFYKVIRLSYDEEYPMREAFENVLLTLDDGSFDFIYIIDGSEMGVSIYIGVKNNHKLNEKLSAANFGDIIRQSFESNYNGSLLKKITNDNDNLKNLLITSPVERFNYVGSIVGVPGIVEGASGKNVDFQGMDRLINSMIGSNWRLVVVCEAVDKGQILSLQNQVYDFYNTLVAFSKINVQIGTNEGTSTNKGKSISDTKGKSQGISENRSAGNSGGNSSETSNLNNSNTKGTQSGISESLTKGESESQSDSSGSSSSYSWEVVNRHATEVIKYIDDELIPRLNTGYTRGMYRTSVSYYADNSANSKRLKTAILSLFKGDKSSFNSLNAIDLPKEFIKQEALSGYGLAKYNKNYESDQSLLMNCRPFSENFIYLSTYLIPKEVSIISALPQKEVPGLSLRESVEFGLNEKTQIDESNSIMLGKIVQNGRVLDIPFSLKKTNLNKHTFIGGVTGSGKTTTCHSLLRNTGCNFLVIEPAKTEYRTLIKSEDFKDVIVFTLGNEKCAPFRFNPFELVEGELLGAHIDTMKAAFTSAFPMEASMPQLLDEAIVCCYEDKGWIIHQNRNILIDEDKIFDEKSDAFPTLGDLTLTLEKVVKKKHFGPELEANYIGSLVSRLSHLTVGTKGSMLNCSRSVNFDFIIKHNVILELDELKSSEDKSLIIGFLLMRLCASVKNAHKKDKEFKHITLVEEAHRLLSRPDFSDGGAKKSAVETFTDMLAEIRKYGEGIIIVDQIPNKLTPDVLKNTNTKIIHKILARDDKEAVGDTMLMNDKQKEYLSALLTGEAIVFSENAEKPIHIKVERITDTNEEEISDEVVEKRFHEIKDKLGCGYFSDDFTDKVYPVFVKVVDDIISSKENSDYFFPFIREINQGKSDANQIIGDLCEHYLEKTGKLKENPNNKDILQKTTNYIADCYNKGRFIYNSGIRKYFV